MISAKIVADSVSPSGIRLTTMELNYPRFIHAEAKTHRVFSLDDEQYELVLKQEVSLMDDIMLSRNASSSRAIPVEKMLQQVRENPAMPIHWGKNQPGMQAREEIDLESIYEATDEWKFAANTACNQAQAFINLGVHKQVVNRLLEPFQYIKVIVTATEWDNFFALRLHLDAQPEIAQLALRMWEAMANSAASVLQPGEWHLPYVRANEIHAFDYQVDKMIKCSVARCARVSYLNHDNTSPDVKKDLELANKLYTAGHMSPFEHVATPMRDSVSGQHYAINNWENGVTHMDRKFNLWSGNFRGWIQHRSLLS